MCLIDSVCLFACSFLSLQTLLSFCRAYENAEQEVRREREAAEQRRKNRELQARLKSPPMKKPM
jgi:hypothetical protein